MCKGTGFIGEKLGAMGLGGDGRIAIRPYRPFRRKKTIFEKNQMMKSIFWLFSGVLVFFVVSCKPEAASLPDDLAKAYGVDHFAQAKSIEFVFHVQKGEKQVDRHWKWYPKDKMVAFISPKGTVYYHQSSELTEEEKALDAKFINDSYWLLFPLHLKWDSKNILTFVEEDVLSPVGKKKTTMLTVKFKNNDGYTPGDAYDLFLSEKNEVLEWTYRKGGGKDGKSMTWENNMIFNGIKISTLHQGNGGFRLWFDGIVVE